MLVNVLRVQHDLKNAVLYNDVHSHQGICRCFPALDQVWWFNIDVFGFRQLALIECSFGEAQIPFINHKNYNFLDCDWFKKLLFPTNSLVKLLSDSLLSDKPITFKVILKLTNHI